MPFDSTNFDYTKVQPVYDRDNPPKRMSEAIRMAVADLELAEANPDYVVDMDQWHLSTTGVCHVCFAGSVMSQRLGLSKSVQVYDHFNPQVPGMDSWLHVFSFLNCVRAGDLRVARLVWDRSPKGAGDLQNTLGVTEYEVSPEAFKADMLALANRLEAEGS